MTAGGRSRSGARCCGTSWPGATPRRRGWRSWIWVLVVRGCWARMNRGGPAPATCASATRTCALPSTGSGPMFAEPGEAHLAGAPSRPDVRGAPVRPDPCYGTKVRTPSPCTLADLRRSPSPACTRRVTIQRSKLLGFGDPARSRSGTAVLRTAPHSSLRRTRARVVPRLATAGELGALAAQLPPRRAGRVRDAQRRPDAASRP